MQSNNSTRPITYICLDTSTILDCAYSRHERANPSLFDKVVERCERAGIKLLIPEVVLLELDKVSGRAENQIRSQFKQLQESVSEMANTGAIGQAIISMLLESVKEAKNSSIEDAQAVVRRVHELVSDDDKARFIPLTIDDVLESVRMCIAGNKPAKRSEQSENKGLIQCDCLIVAALHRFSSNHPGDRIVFCSHNVHDYAQKAKTDEGADEYMLHPSIRERVGDWKFYADPVKLLKAEVHTSDANSDDELDVYEEPYRKVSASGTFSLAERNLSAIGGPGKAVSEYYKDSNSYKMVVPNMPRIAEAVSDAMPNVSGLSSVISKLEMPQFAGIAEMAMRSYEPTMAALPTLQNVAKMAIPDIAWNSALADKLNVPYGYSEGLGGISSLNDSEDSGDDIEEDDDKEE